MAENDSHDQRNEVVDASSTACLFTLTVYCLLMFTELPGGHYDSPMRWGCYLLPSETEGRGGTVIR